MAKKTNVDRKSSPNKKEDPKRVISNANIPNNVSENPQDHMDGKSNGEKGSGNTKPENTLIQNQRKQMSINEFEMIEQAGKNVDAQIRPQESNNAVEQKSMNIALKKSTDYVKFFKFYYEKYVKEHPKWTSTQITTIISLLWKKKKINDSIPVEKQSVRSVSRRSNKPLSAKDAFKIQHKQMTKNQLDELWTKLPKESKSFWKKQGDSYGNMSEVSSVKDAKFPLKMFNPARFLLNSI